jgi:putative ABC transport system permease protein
MGALWQDVRYGARVLTRSPGFTLASVLILALGIGANTAIFSVVNGVLLRPLPYPEPERLVMVWANVERRGGPAQEWTNPADLHDWRTQNQVFEDMAALAGDEATLGGEGEPEQIAAAVVTHPMFRVLNIRPALGRDFRVEDDQPDGRSVVLLSHGLWQRRYGGDPQIVGRTITWDGRPFTVIGVMPAGFRFPVIPAAELWTPLGQPPEHRGNAYLRVVARLKPGVTLAQAQADMGVIASRLEMQYPDTNEKLGVTLTRLSDFLAGPARRALLVLQAAVASVLLIACANVANLLLARGTAREKEIAVRLALGAGRGRLLRQLLMESALLSAAGAGLGLLFAAWGLDFLIAGLPADGRAFFAVQIDSVVLWFTVAVAALTALLFGVMPARQALRLRLQDSLKEGRAASPRRGRLRQMLVASEMALSLVLLVGAGLLLRSFAELVWVDLGFKAERVLQARLLLPRIRYADGAPVRQGFAQIVERARALPGVTGAAGTSNPPLSGIDADMVFRVEGRPEAKVGEQAVAWYRSVTPDYFATLGIALRRGRMFNEGDGPDGPHVALINESFARKYFPGEDPLSKRIGHPRLWRQVVGIVGNVRNFGLDREEPPAVYLPHAQASFRFMTLLVRTHGDPSALAAGLRGAVREVDPDLALANVSTMEQTVARSVSDRRWTMILLGVFAGLALLLAVIGLYGVLAYSVAQRTSEIGVRMALGAQRQDVLWLIVAQSARMWGSGLLTGVVGAVVAARAMSGLLYGVEALDGVTFFAAPLVLGGVAFAASLLPALRAARVDPVVALRYE